jgi:TetR/AcrR family transcriptional regulator, cholesterol catabolism regulator
VVRCTAQQNLRREMGTMASRTQRPSDKRVIKRTTPNTSSQHKTGAAAPATLARAVRKNGSSNSQDKHAEIFSAALRLFQAKGYHGASMQDLADAVGMQKASLYYYFSSKEDLLVLVCERGTSAFTQELNDIVASDLSATEKLKRAIECHVVALCEQLDLFTVFLREQKFLSDLHKTRLRGEGKHHAELLAQILEQGIAAREFRPVNVTVTTLAILGMSNWLYEWYSPDGARTPSEIATILSELVLNGLKQPARAAARAKKRKHRNT